MEAESALAGLLIWLVPVALGMGIVGLGAFLWSMKSGQLEDLDGAAHRVLLSEAEEAPLPDQEHSFRKTHRNGENDAGIRG